MTERKTLKIRAPSAEDAPPALKKRGRGWEISEKRLDAQKLLRISLEGSVG